MPATCRQTQQVKSSHGQNTYLNDVKEGVLK